MNSETDGACFLPDTPDSIGPLTTYTKAAPTDQVVLFPGQTPDPSTLEAAHSLSDSNIPPIPSSGWPAPTDSVSSSAPPKTPSSASSTHPVTKNRPNTKSASKTAATPASSTSVPAPTHTSSGGMSTGTKVGIGVGVAGGVCLLAAIGIVWFFLRRRKTRDNQIQEGNHGQAPQYAPYGGEKPPPGGWQGQPYPGSPQGYHYNPSYAYQGVPAVIHEAGQTPSEEETVRKRLSPPQPPVEMEGQHQFPEMESRPPSRPPASPAK